MSTPVAIALGFVLDIVFFWVIYKIHKLVKSKDSSIIVELKELQKSDPDGITPEKIKGLIEQIELFFDPVKNFRNVRKIEHIRRYDGTHVIVLNIDYVEEDQSFLSRERTLGLIKLSHDLGLDFAIYPHYTLGLTIIFEIK